MSRLRNGWLAMVAGASVSLVLGSPAHALICGAVFNPLTVSASAMSFGSYTATNPAAATTTGTITLSCQIALDLLPSFTVAISAGSSGTYAPRRMTSGARQLNYNLYTTAAHATVWGDGTGGTVTQSYNSNLLSGAINFTVYGAAPAGQWTGAGAYQDTLVVTVTY